MNRELLIEQIMARIGPGIPGDPPGPGIAAGDRLALARALKAARTESVAELLGDIENTYKDHAESQSSMRMALRFSTAAVQEATATLDRRAAEVDLVHRVSLVARDARSQEDVIRLCLEAVCQILRWPLGHALVPKGHELGSSGTWHVGSEALAARAGVARIAIDEFKAVRAARVQKPGHHLAADAALARRPRWSDDPELLPLSKELDDYGIRALCALPIVVGEEPIAALEIFSYKPGAPEAHALGLVEDLARQVGIMLARRKAEEAIHTHAGLLNATLDSTPDGVLVVDTEGRTLLANRRFSEMWGIPDELMSARDDARMLAHVMGRLADPESFGKRVQELYHSDAESYDEFEFKDGRIFERWTRAVRDAGQVIGRIWVFRDVTERRRVEGERSVLEEQLRHAQKMEAIGHLAGGVAHDFNNLLTVIQGNAQIALMRVEEGSKVSHSLEEIRRAGERASALTRQLLAFSRKQVLSVELLDLCRVCTEMESMLRRVIGEDVELVHRPHGGPVMVKADPTQLEQVIMNLAINARDAMPEGGRLTIETGEFEQDEAGFGRQKDLQPGCYATISVSDTGCGMDEETVQRIFEPFFTTKETGRGTGLGLSMAYGIVTQSGGAIRVESAPGQGSTFRIYLPRTEGALPEARDARSAPAGAHGTETILVVEDEHQVRDLAVRFLEARGYNVLRASDGVQAIKVCREHEGPIQLLLTDVIMPEMNGRHLAEHVRNLRPGIKVVYMSGYIDDAIVRQGNLPPGTAFLAKPFTLESLSGRIRQALDPAAPGWRDARAPGDADQAA